MKVAVAKIQLCLWNSCSSTERKYCLIFQNKNSFYFCIITNLAFIVCGQTKELVPQLISPRADGCNLQLDKFRLERSCVLVRDAVISQLTNWPHRFLFSWSLYINIYAFLYICFCIKKAVTAASYLNLGMKSLDCEITAFPLTLKSVSL